jgi:hypothetical protein
VAEAVDDNTWLSWLLPADYQIQTEEGRAKPRNAGDAVDRLGLGLEPSVLELLRFQGLFAAYQLLSVFSHGNLAAAMILHDGKDGNLPPVAAVIAHVAAVGASAVILEHCDASPIDRDKVLTAVGSVTNSASRIHQLPAKQLTSEKAPAKARNVKAVTYKGLDITYPEIPEALLAAAKRFLSEALNLSLEVAKSNLFDDYGAILAFTSFQYALTQISILSGVIEETLGSSLLPFAARTLYEDGARWAWLRAQLAKDPMSHPFSSLVSDCSNLIKKVVSLLETEEVPSDVIQSLLGGSLDFPKGDNPKRILPKIDVLVSAAYMNPSNVDSAKPTYAFLSQFVHSTPISVLQLRPGRWTSLNAPSFAISVEAACRGFRTVAQVTLTMSLEMTAELRSRLQLLDNAVIGVVESAMDSHFLG